MDAMFDGEMRLFLEELCCELCRFRHAADNGIDPDEINIAREVRLAPLGAFADIVVTLPAAPAYFVEIKYGLRSKKPYAAFVANILQTIGLCPRKLQMSVLPPI